MNFMFSLHRLLTAIGRNRMPAVLSNSLGISLMETVIALGLFSSAGTAVLMGVRAAHTGGDVVNSSSVGENLARNQMEYLMTLSYVSPGGTYQSIADAPGEGFSIPPGYGVTAATQSYVSDDGLPGSIERVVVTVTRDGQSVFVLESLRSGP